MSKCKRLDIRDWGEIIDKHRGRPRPFQPNSIEQDQNRSVYNGPPIKEPREDSRLLKNEIDRLNEEVRNLRSKLALIDIIITETHYDRKWEVLEESLLRIPLNKIHREVKIV